MLALRSDNGVSDDCDAVHNSAFENGPAGWPAPYSGGSPVAGQLRDGDQQFQNTGPRVAEGP